MAAETKFNNHTLVDFEKLHTGDSEEIERLETEFIIHGWCFIRLPDEKGRLGTKLNQAQSVLMNFFAQDEISKSNHKSVLTGLGYSNVEHKEGIKLLIDEDGLQEYHSRFPKDVEKTLKYLSKLMYHLTDVIKNVIFQMSTFSKSPTKTSVKLSPLGMLDIVHYFNKRTGPPVQPKVGLDTNEVNCVPHFDPGLFSLSILSTCDGLQLNDQLKDQWIDGPVNTGFDKQYIGVLWLGEAASILTENRFRSGIHRVVYPRVAHQPRLTIWQEICTQSQIDTVLQKNIKDDYLSDGTTFQIQNQPLSKPLKVLPGGENMSSVMRRVEIERGLGTSKSDEPYFKTVSRNNVDNNIDDDEIPRKTSLSTRNATGNANRLSTNNYLPRGASVTMNNQPNSRPMIVSKDNQNVSDFMREMENQRGLSMSKSGVEHMNIRIPVSAAGNDDNSKKKKSFFSNFFG